jgi:integrase
MSHRITFTPAQIDAIEAPAEGRAVYYDATKPGLGLRVFPTGRSVWFWIGKHKGRTVRETIGPYRKAPDADVQFSPAKAWTMTKLVAGKVSAGERPTEEKRAEREAAAAEAAADAARLTLGGTYADYCAHHSVRSTRTRDSEWSCYLKRWEDSALDSITRVMVRDWFRELTKTTSPSTANRALARLKALYSWAATEMDYEGANPTAGILKHSEKPARRKRRLRMDELAAFFKAMDSVSRDMADFFKVTLFTGQRSGNVRSMRWADLDLGGGRWMIPQTKQGEATEVVLAPQVVELLTERQKYLAERVKQRKARWAKKRKGPEPKASPFVFPAKRGGGHLVTYRKAWVELCEAAGIDGLRVHDLRRSLASFAQDSGIGTAIVAAQLGHADAATTLRHYTTIGGQAQADAIEAVVASLLRGGQS